MSPRSGTSPPARGRRPRARRPRRGASPRRSPVASGRARPCPPSSRDAARSSRVTSPTVRFGVSAIRRTSPPLCSTTASWACRSSATTSAPERSGAGNGRVSSPRAVSRNAACSSSRLWRRERRRQLSEHLRVGMEGVAGLAPRLVGKSRPPVGHGPTLAAMDGARRSRAVVAPSTAIVATERGRLLPFSRGHDANPGGPRFGRQIRARARWMVGPST